MVQREQAPFWTIAALCTNDAWSSRPPIPPGSTNVSWNNHSYRLPPSRPRAGSRLRGSAPSAAGRSVQCAALRCRPHNRRRSRCNRPVGVRRRPRRRRTRRRGSGRTAPAGRDGRRPAAGVAGAVRRAAAGSSSAGSSSSSSVELAEGGAATVAGVGGARGGRFDRPARGDCRATRGRRRRRRARRRADRRACSVRSSAGADVAPSERPVNETRPVAVTRARAMSRFRARPRRRGAIVAAPSERDLQCDLRPVGIVARTLVAHRRLPIGRSLGTCREAVSRRVPGAAISADSSSRSWRATPASTARCQPDRAPTAVDRGRPSRRAAP